MRQPTKESALKRALRTPQFRMRVVRDRTQYQRHPKHRQRDLSLRMGVFYADDQQMV